jgi:hypothetical protein
MFTGMVARPGIEPGTQGFSVPVLDVSQKLVFVLNCSDVASSIVACRKYKNMNKSTVRNSSGQKSVQEVSKRIK